jgi:hypothetical protein
MTDQQAKVFAVELLRTKLCSQKDVVAHFGIPVSIDLSAFSEALDYLRRALRTQAARTVPTYILRPNGSIERIKGSRE